MKSEVLFRCSWADKHPLLTTYHDKEWGVIQKDDNKLFEMFSLDCFQAGLSWLTILKKREAFMDAYDGFTIDKVAQYTTRNIEALLQNPGIVRNRLKIPAIVNNAGKIQEIRSEYGSFSKFIWGFTDGKMIINHWKTLNEIPATSKESDNMSKEMKKRGIQFAGSTICYSFMQSVGMVNDHLTDCFRYNNIH